MNKLIDIFCDVDDFCHKFLPSWVVELIAYEAKKDKDPLKYPPLNA